MPFLRGLFLEGLIYGGPKSIGLANLVPRALFPGFGGGPHHQSQGNAPWERGCGLASQLEVNLPFLLSFTLYLRTILQVQAPGGLKFGGTIWRRVFCVTGLGGLYLGGGGAYIWRGLYMKGLIFGILRYSILPHYKIPSREILFFI